MLHLTQPADPPRGLAYDPDGRSLVAIDAGRVTRWNLATGEPMVLQIRARKSEQFTAIAALSEQLIVGTSKGDLYWGGNFRFDAPITSICAGPAGVAVGTGYVVNRQFSGGSVRAFGDDPGALDVGGRGCFALAVNPRRCQFAIARELGVILWDPRDGNRREFVLAEPSHAFLAVGKDVRDVAFHPEGEVLAVAAGWAVELWDTKARERFGELRGHTHEVIGVEFVRDGSQVVSMSRDKTVKILDWKSQRVIESFSWGLGVLSGLAVSPAGDTLAVCGKGGIVVWEAP